MTDLLFPPLSTQRPDAEGVVTRWFVPDGEHVTAGQLVAEVQVDNRRHVIYMRKALLR